MKSWLAQIREAEARLTEPADPWRCAWSAYAVKLVTMVSSEFQTQTLFDHLEVLQNSRGAGASRRLAEIMRSLGWTPVRVRDLTRGGYKEQVRGYCRDRVRR